MIFSTNQENGWEILHSIYIYEIVLVDAKIGKRLYSIVRQNANTGNPQDTLEIGTICSKASVITAVIEDKNYDTVYPQEENKYHECMPAFIKWLYAIKLSSLVL